MTMARHCRITRLWRSDAGSALVEFSLLVPFLLTLALGMFGFGRFIYQYQLVVEGLRDAGRYIARFDPVQYTTGEYATFQSNAKNLAVTATTAAGGTARVAGWTTNDIVFNTTSVDNAAGTYRGGAIIRVIKVSTTFTYDDLGLLAALGLGPLSFKASHEQRVIGE